MYLELYYEHAGSLVYKAWDSGYGTGTARAGAKSKFINGYWWRIADHFAGGTHIDAHTSNRAWVSC